MVGLSTVSFDWGDHWVIWFLGAVLLIIGGPIIVSESHCVSFDWGDRWVIWFLGAVLLLIGGPIIVSESHCVSSLACHT